MVDELASASPSMRACGMTGMLGARPRWGW